MRTNSRKVLDMLSEGKISAEEAERLLQRVVTMGEAEDEAPSEVSTAPETDPFARERPVPENPKFLRIAVDSNKGDKINVRVPMALIRTGVRFAALLPSDARKNLEEHGVDLAALSELDPEELVQALAALTVDVDGANGDKVRVFCE